MAIRVLDKKVSELIAAGEVIERPASIVKELMENSIDANAAAITVEIKHGGITYIRVTDNGCGIEHSEAPTAFLRHATSKISNETDLTSIWTLGFRGEALASVCAVAKVEMLTKRPEDVFGTRVYVEGGIQKDFSDAGCADGTTIIVKDLFYNVPARLKFMKKDTTETAAVTDIVEHIALSHPEISIKFIKDNKQVLNTPGNGKLLSSIYSVIGKEFAENLMPTEYTYDGIKVSGFVSDPMHGRKNRMYQHFFVNGRYVKTKVGAIALDEAYKNSIMIGKFPACVLQIELDADKVDVNVHPAKTEIRFTNERKVYDAIYFAVKTAINAHNSIEDIAQKEDRQKQAVIKAIQTNAFKADSGEQIKLTHTTNTVKPNLSETTLEIKEIMQSEKNDYPVAEKAENKSVSKFSRIVLEDEDSTNNGNVADSGTNLYTTQKQQDEFVFLNSDSFKKQDKKQTEVNSEIQSDKTPKSAITVSEDTKSVKEDKEVLPIKLLGEIFGTYILAQQGDVFLIVDKHAAHERIIFEQLKVKRMNDSQILLTPLNVNLSRGTYTCLLENISVLKNMGFDVDDFGGSSVAVRAVPSVLEPYNIKEIIEEIAENLLSLKKSADPSVLEDLYHSVACKAAIRANDKNNDAELMEILERVCNDESIRYCPHGRPVLVTMTEYELKRKFGR